MDSLLDMKTISKDEVMSRLRRADAVVVNVLDRSAYDKIHIKGSISIPREELEKGRWKELDRDKEVITYCASYDCGASRKAAEFLASKGFDVKAYEGGIREWAEEGLPTPGRISPPQYLAAEYRKRAALAQRAS